MKQLCNNGFEISQCPFRGPLLGCRDCLFRKQSAGRGKPFSIPRVSLSGKKPHEEKDVFVQKDPGDQPVIETTNDEFIEYPSVVGLELDPMQALLDQLEAQVEAITEPGAPTTMKLEDPLDQLEFIHQPFPFETIISPEQTSPSDLSEKIPVNPPPLDPWGWEDPLANSQEFDGPPDNLYGPLRDDWNPWDERPPRDNLLRSDEPYPADPWADW